VRLIASTLFLTVALASCVTPQPTAPDISGLYQGQVTFTTCYPGTKANLTLEVSKTTDPLIFNGKLTAFEAVNISGSYDVNAKTFTFTTNGTGASALVMTLSTNAALTSLNGTYTQTPAPGCSDGQSTARGTLTVSKP
jgi:hypothetical protein